MVFPQIFPRWLAGFGLVFLGLSATNAYSELIPIYLKPGQCIMLSGQQVCGATEDLNSTLANPDKDQKIVTKICKWGAIDDSDANLKGYGLYVVTVTTDGKKSEALLKSYGPADKAGCEQAAGIH